MPSGQSLRCSPLHTSHRRVWDTFIRLRASRGIHGRWPLARRGTIPMMHRGVKAEAERAALAGWLAGWPAVMSAAFTGDRPSPSSARGGAGRRRGCRGRGPPNSSLITAKIALGHSPRPIGPSAVPCRAMPCRALPRLALPCRAIPGEHGAVQQTVK